MNTPWGLRASEMPMTELAVPMPWQNAVTRPSVCSQISRPSRSTWSGMMYGLVELIGGVVPRLSRQLARPRDHPVDVLSGHEALALDGRDHLELRAERPHQLHPLLAEAVG